MDGIWRLQVQKSGELKGVRVRVSKAKFRNTKFDLSTGNPQMISGTYPQENFMLQCFFLGKPGRQMHAYFIGKDLREDVEAQSPLGPKRNRSEHVSDQGSERL